MFVVSCDLLDSGEPDSLGADEGSHSLRVLVQAQHAALAHDDGVDVGVHLGADEGDVVEQVHAPVLDRFDWRWAAAEHSWG